MNSFTSNIYNFLNTSNETHPYFEPHDIFIKDVKFDKCGEVMNRPYNEKCTFVENEPACYKHVHVVNYMKIMFCYVSLAESRLVDWIYIFMLALCVFYVYQLLRFIIKNFFIPALNYIARKMRFSQSLAGATLLSIGNGASTLYMSWTNLDADTVGLWNGGFGSAIFHLSIVAGTVLVISPFHVYQPLHARDSLFMLNLLTYLEYIMFDKTVNVYECIILLVFYAFFITTVIIDVIIIKRLSKDIHKKLKQIENGRADDNLQRKLDELKEEGVLEILIKDSRSVLDIETTKSTSFINKGGPNVNLFRQFVESLNPINEGEWRKAPCIGKFLSAILTPLTFIYILVCPRVDYNSINHGWSKLLNIVHIFSAPFYIITFSDMKFMQFHGLSIYVYMLAVAIPFMIIVFFTSRTDSAPFYHITYAVFTLCMTMALIRMCARELTSITFTMGTASQVSPTFISVTLHSWESGIGSLITNTILASQGYPRMAFASCYGSPLFIEALPLNFGVRLLYKSLKSPTGIAKVRQGPLGTTHFAVLFSIVFFSFLGILLAKNKGRKSLGIYRIIIYPLFLVFVVCAEFEFIHGHGADHVDQRIKAD